MASSVFGVTALEPFEEVSGVVREPWCWDVGMPGRHDDGCEEKADEIVRSFSFCLLFLVWLRRMRHPYRPLPRQPHPPRPRSTDTTLMNPPSLDIVPPRSVPNHPPITQSANHLPVGSVFVGKRAQRGKKSTGWIPYSCGRCHSQRKGSSLMVEDT
jgi:hypothetical protein